VQGLRCCIGESMIVVPVDTVPFTGILGLCKSCVDQEWGLTDCISSIVMRDRDSGGCGRGDQHFQQAGFCPLKVGVGS
jgi:predicted nucleic acid-binding protein